MSADAHASRFVRVRMIVHAGVWIIVFVSMGTWLTTYMLWTLKDPLAKTDKPLPRREVVPLHADASEEVETSNAVSRDGQFSEPVVPGHFHHIGRSYELDRSNFCIDCHGWLPHARNKQMRSFLNMHTIFTDCMICHVQLQKETLPDQFAWRRLKDGTLSDSVSTSTTSWGDYGYKIMPVVRDADGAPQAWTLTKEEGLAVDYDEKKEEMDMLTKTSSIKLIHQRCVEKPLRCKRCHVAEDGILPFAKLGYDLERRTFLSNIEVVEILETNKVFHLPELLEPNGRSKGNGQGDASSQASPQKTEKPPAQGDAAHD